MSGPSVDTKGSTNTECMVFVHTHDRGPEHASQKIDLSAYITAVTVNQHLTSGGSAVINLPAVDHIENIIAAGDLINIYFNTHRDDANVYNRGWVRTFFGYVSNVAKVVSVGGEGEKLTTYTIQCSDFSKAVRNSQIYNNDHLASQGENQKYGVIREDMSTNLGGVALLSQGIALQGTPRQIILQNLMRFLGFGGQFALPPSYVESLPDASHIFAPSTESGKVEAITSLQAVTAAVMAQDDEGVKNEFIDALLDLSKISDDKNSVSDLWSAVYTGNTSVNIGSAAQAKVKNLQSKYRPLFFNLKKVESGKLYSQLNNTFFRIRGLYEDAGINFLNQERVVGPEEQGLKSDFNTVLARVINEIEAVNPEALKEDISGFPKANLYAQAFPDEKNNQRVRTIFNILCLDYMEDVGGFWANFAMLSFQGSLYNALQKGSNHTMNELFFDLRPSPDFRPIAQDGLGVHLDGAIPMVPAVVLRRKPFTNYQKPNSEISNADISGHLVIGGYKTGDISGMSDQLVVNSGGTLGALGAVAVSPSEMTQVKQSLAAVGLPKSKIPEVSEIEEKTVVAPTQGRASQSPVAPTPSQEEALAAWREKMVGLSQEALKDGVNKNDYLLKMLSHGAVGVPGSYETTSAYISTQMFFGEVKIAKKALASYITLPRPIFRSPDKNRITKELDIAQTQHILGYLRKDDDAESTQFYAFGTGTKPGAGVKSSSMSSDISLDSQTRSGGGVEEWIDNDNAMLIHGSSMHTLNSKLSAKKDLINEEKLTKEQADETDWHVLDYMTINPTDVISENYTRGDFDVVNFLEYFGSSIGGFEAQRLFLGTVMPIVTPISVYRFGVRVFSESTDFVQALLSGATDHLFEKNILLRWAVLQDMWNQHNHELLSGSMSLKGMPGLRPGYRVDRLDINLSFYVESVSHSWGHPGHLSTQITLSRGQPYGAENALRYERPTPSTPSYASERQELGKVFNTAKFKRGTNAWVGGQNDYELGTPGTYTGKAATGKQLKVEGRPKDPWLSTLLDESLDE